MCQNDSDRWLYFSDMPLGGWTMLETLLGSANRERVLVFIAAAEPPESDCQVMPRESELSVAGTGCAMARTKKRGHG